MITKRSFDNNISYYKYYVIINNIDCYKYCVICDNINMLILKETLMIILTDMNIKLLVMTQICDH